MAIPAQSRRSPLATRHDAPHRAGSYARPVANKCDDDLGGCEGLDYNAPTFGGNAAMKTYKIKTYSGFEFDVRLSAGADDALLAEFWTHVSKDRVGARLLGEDNIAQRVELGAPVDKLSDTTSTYLAIGGDGLVLAVAILICDHANKTARVMAFTRDGATFHGVSWALLAHVLEYAQAAGIETVSSVFDASDVNAIRLELKMGFTETVYPGEPSLRLLRWTWPPARKPL